MLLQEADSEEGMVVLQEFDCEEERVVQQKPDCEEGMEQVRLQSPCRCRCCPERCASETRHSCFDDEEPEHFQNPASDPLLA